MKRDKARDTGTKHKMKNGMHCRIKESESKNYGGRGRESTRRRKVGKGEVSSKDQQNETRGMGRDGGGDERGGGEDVR